MNYSRIKSDRNERWKVDGGNRNLKASERASTCALAVFSLARPSNEVSRCNNFISAERAKAFNRGETPKDKAQREREREKEERRKRGENLARLGSFAAAAREQGRNKEKETFINIGIRGPREKKCASL